MTDIDTACVDYVPIAIDPWGEPIVNSWRKMARQYRSESRLDAAHRCELIADGLNADGDINGVPQLRGYKP